jgi:large subunit ribosomal protein L20
MSRVKRGAVARIRRRKVLYWSKGRMGSNSRLFRIAKQQVIKSNNASYRGRRRRKRLFRSLWIIRLQRAVKILGIDYRSVVYRLRRHKCLLNRKVITQLILTDGDYIFNTSICPFLMYL